MVHDCELCWHLEMPEYATVRAHNSLVPIMHKRPVAQSGYGYQLLDRRLSCAKRRQSLAQGLGCLALGLRNNVQQDRTLSARVGARITELKAIGSGLCGRG